MRCRIKSCIDVAVADIELRKKVVGSIPVNRRRIRRHGGSAVGDGRQRIVVDFDERGSVFGDITVLRDDNGHGLADMDDLAFSEGGPVPVLLV